MVELDYVSKARRPVRSAKLVGIGDHLSPHDKNPATKLGYLAYVSSLAVAPHRENASS
jgi:hypothetical protein